MHGSTRLRRRLAGVSVVAAAVMVMTLVPGAPGAATAAPGSRGGVSAQAGQGWTYERAAAPARTLVRDSTGRLLATFTDGSRTVTVAGPRRTFSEPTAAASVRTTTWVRLLPAAFTGAVDEAWLTAALRDSSRDVLATGMRFVAGAPQDASYGPLVDGARQEGSDWNDYLGVAATYDGVVDRPERDQRGALDCSGFVRMLYGHLGGLPMVLEPDGLRLPRRAVQMAASAPGNVLVPDTGVQVTDFSALLAGDLVFFDVSDDDGADVDHVGLYLGLDSAGRHRFLSSRKSIDGPTMGDHRGRSTLDGTGLYARGFRAVRRL